MPTSVDLVNQSPDARADAVFDTIHALMHLYRAQQHRSLDGFTHLESKVLGFFDRHPGATQSDLIALSGRDKGQVARLVSGLKERGLLASRVDGTDRRVQRLELAEAGRETLAAAKRQGRRVARAALAGVDEAEQRRLLDLLQRIRANLEGPGGERPRDLHRS